MVNQHDVSRSQILTRLLSMLAASVEECATAQIAGRHVEGFPGFGSAEVALQAEVNNHGSPGEPGAFCRPVMRR